MDRPPVSQFVPRFIRERYARKLVATLLVLVLVVTALGIGATLAVRGDIAAAVTDRYTEMATAEAESLELWHEDNVDFVGHVAGTMAFEGHNDSQIREQLYSHRAREGAPIQDIHYVNTTGDRVTVSTSEAMGGRSLEAVDAPWSTVKNASVTDVYTTGVYWGNGSVDNESLIAYVTPVTVGGQRDRLLVVTVRPSDYTATIDDDAGTRTMVVDDRGRVLSASEFQVSREYANDSASEAPLTRARAAGASAPGAMRAPAAQSVADALGIDPGTNVFVGYSQVGDIGWVVLVHTPASQAFTTVDDVLWSGLAATLLAAAFVTLVGYLVGKDATDAIDELRAKSEQLQQGNYDVDFTTDRIDDLGQLYERFGHMAEALAAREASLQAERDRLGALFEHSSDCIAHVERGDGRLVVRDVNPRFADRFGYDRAAVAGESLLELAGPPDRTGEPDPLPNRIQRGEEFQWELRRRTADGVGDFLFRFVPTTGRDDDAAPTEGYAVYTDITERKQAERELGRQRFLLERTQELAQVGAWELDLRTDPPRKRQLTDEIKRIHGVPLDEPFDLETGTDYYHPDDQLHIRRAVEEAMEDGESYDLEARLVTADGDLRWVRTTGEPVYEDGDIVKLRGVLQDVTDRKGYELTLQSLHDATRRLLHTETEQGICDVAIDIAEEIIDVPGVALYLLDSEHSQFVPAAFTPGFVDICEGAPPLPTGDEHSPVWNAFVSSEIITLDGRDANLSPDAEQAGDQIFTDTRVDPDDTVNGQDGIVQQGVFLPVGDHGVLTLLSTDGDIGDQTRQLAETLVATTEAAFNRLESESELRERDEQLQAQNEQLKRQIQLTEIIRSVDQSLIDARSREEIKTAVCERLVESDPISFAWIGDHDGETLRPETWAGDGQRYLDSVSLSADSGEPAWVTATTGTASVASNVVDRLRSEAWRKAALEHGFRSVVSVPITHDEYTYGVLTAYAPEADAFGDLQRSVFVELGETIGNTINAVQTKQALYADTVTELTLEFTGAESLLSTLATEADCRVESAGFSADTGDATWQFFTVSGADPATVREVLDRLVTVTDYREITTTEDGGFFSATVSEGLVTSTFIPRGLTPREMIAESGTLTVTVDVLQEIDVREFVELLEERYPSTELVARRDVERSIETKGDLVGSLLEGLTDRQRETLTTAYYSGYFEWPRETTGQEVAAMLGVSQPTVTRHLRLGQQALLRQLLDGDYQPTPATI